jgi:hypothetical protein
MTNEVWESPSLTACFYRYIISNDREGLATFLFMVDQRGGVIGTSRKGPNLPVHEIVNRIAIYKEKCRNLEEPIDEESGDWTLDTVWVPVNGK